MLEENSHLSDHSRFQAHMPPASRAPGLFLLITHSLRCGLEEFRQLRWLGLPDLPCFSLSQDLKIFHAIALGTI